LNVFELLADGDALRAQIAKDIQQALAWRG